MDMTSCRKIGEMNNNINGQPLYSTGLYTVLELPNQKPNLQNKFIRLSNPGKSCDNHFSPQLIYFKLLKILQIHRLNLEALYNSNGYKKFDKYV